MLDTEFSELSEEVASVSVCLPPSVVRTLPPDASLQFSLKGPSLVEKNTHLCKVSRLMNYKLAPDLAFF